VGGGIRRAPCETGLTEPARRVDRGRVGEDTSADRRQGRSDTRKGSGSMTTTVSAPATRTYDSARVYQDGIVAGILAALAVALWFLIVDTVRGQPLYTPSVLGTALFRREAPLVPLAATPVSADMVLMFTWVHGLVFAGLGGIAAWLLGVAERSPQLGFGIILLFVIFESCFTMAAYLIAAPVLQALTWPAVVVGNLLAAAVMAAYL